MTLQTAYNYVRYHPNTTANIPRNIRCCQAMIAYNRVKRLVELGYVEKVPSADRYTRYRATKKMDVYARGNRVIVSPF